MDDKNPMIQIRRAEQEAQAAAAAAREAARQKTAEVISQKNEELRRRLEQTKRDNDEYAARLEKEIDNRLAVEEREAAGKNRRRKDEMINKAAKAAADIADKIIG